MRDGRFVFGKIHARSVEHGLAQCGFDRLVRGAFRIKLCDTAHRAEPHSVTSPCAIDDAGTAEIIAQRIHCDASGFFKILFHSRAAENIQQPAGACEHPVDVGSDEPLLAVEQIARDRLQDDEERLQIARVWHDKLGDEHPQRMFVAPHRHGERIALFAERRRGLHDCSARIRQPLTDRCERCGEDAACSDDDTRRPRIFRTGKNRERACIQQRTQKFEQRAQLAGFGERSELLLHARTVRQARCRRCRGLPGLCGCGLRGGTVHLPKEKSARVLTGATTFSPLSWQRQQPAPV